ncbi:hypothetical protein PR048_028800 [Dryococelus australis]|uniref:Mutator-like transposase domain-containing protein n=1 Tax=Dryococelus australis TaxID=614101 RepID=A0ABQ9GC72_9NEOP|nr:hypothetical protein PR048_028800 [Dryococelus australis]
MNDIKTTEVFSTLVFRASEAINTASISTQDCVLPNNIPHLHDDTELKGRRIVDIGHMFSSIQSINDHAPFGCSFSDMEATKETCQGLATIGVGFSQPGEFFAPLDMPFMSKSTWNNRQEQVPTLFQEVANKEMEKAAKDDATLARECGDVNKDGFPLVTVVADCMWGKRSYRNKYNSLSGTATEIKKVLRLEAKNKYCAICDRKHRKSNIPLHKCYKNWTGASTAMEAYGIVSGFTKTVPLRGFKYAQSIGDEDSSAHKKQIESLPHGPDFLSEKIECRDHILRNYANRIRELSLNKILGQFNRGVRSNRTYCDCIKGRSQCAVVAHNSKSELHRLVHKTLTNRSPGVFTKKYIAQRTGPALNYANIERTCSPKRRVFEILQEECTDERRRAMQSNTKIELLDKNDESTASCFSKICKMRTMTSCASVVEYLRYLTLSGNTDTRWGMEMEATALLSVSEIIGKTFKSVVSLFTKSTLILKQLLMTSKKNINLYSSFYEYG